MQKHCVAIKFVYEGDHGLLSDKQVPPMLWPEVKLFNRLVKQTARWEDVVRGVREALQTDEGLKTLNAGNYPEKPVTVISDAAAGATPDVDARFVAEGLSKIWRRQVVVINHPGANGSIAANRTRASLQAFFGWAITRGLVEQNPAVGTHKAPESTRSRVLPLAELAHVWRASGDDAYGAVIKMLILTGQRRDEIGGLRWDEVRDDMIVLPGDRTKNRRPHVVVGTGTRNPCRPTANQRVRLR